MKILKLIIIASIILMIIPLPVNILILKNQVAIQTWNNFWPVSLIFLPIFFIGPVVVNILLPKRETVI